MRQRIESLTHDEKSDLKRDLGLPAREFFKEASSESLQVMQELASLALKQLVGDGE